MTLTTMTLFAYIDPFTGYLVLQVLAMAFFAVVVFLRKCRDFVFGLFGFKPKKSETLDNESETLAFSDNTCPVQQQKEAA